MNLSGVRATAWLACNPPKQIWRQTLEMTAALEAINYTSRELSTKIEVNFPSNGGLLWWYPPSRVEGPVDSTIKSALEPVSHRNTHPSREPLWRNRDAALGYETRDAKHLQR